VPNAKPPSSRREVFAAVRRASFAIVIAPKGQPTRPEHVPDFLRENMIIAGTGFVADSDGYALTAAHVILQLVEKVPQFPPMAIFHAPTRKGQGPNGSDLLRLPVSPLAAVRFHPDHDIAALRLLPLRTEGFHPLPLSTRGAREGDAIALCGYPSGKQLHADLLGGFFMPPSFSQGIVSAVIPYPEVEVGEATVIQVDAISSPGNSGGPAFDPNKGDIIGVLTAVSLGDFEIAGADGVKRQVRLPIGLSRVVPVQHGGRPLSDLRAGKADRQWEPPKP
jgi:S1-C subfamily serine protease